MILFVEYCTDTLHNTVDLYTCFLRFEITTVVDFLPQSIKKKFVLKIGI